MRFVGVAGEVFNFPLITSLREKNTITSIYRSLFPCGTLRLDFANFPSETIGDGTSPKVAIAPPRLAYLLKILLYPHLFLGESYMNGEWFVTEGDLSDFMCLIFNKRHNKYLRLRDRLSGSLGIIFFLRQILFPLAYRRHVSTHYNINGSFYENWLDLDMQYSCAIFEHEKMNLEDAQNNKMRIIQSRLQLENELNVLEIGCGWGGFSRFIAQNYNLSLTGITISSGQYYWAEKCKATLDEKIQKRLSYALADYRTFLDDKRNQFDRVVSVAMLEALGLGQIPHFFKTVESVLKPGGKALIHTIIRPYPTHINEWINRYVFPGSYVPTIADIERAIEKTGLDTENIFLIEPKQYFMTLQKWRDNFYRAWPNIKNDIYDGRFFRMWDFYLAGVQNNFRREQLNFKIAHIVVSKI
jgi:cyclopropane-fatty-acyl-phospholipid synthase